MKKLIQLSTLLFVLAIMAFTISSCSKKPQDSYYSAFGVFKVLPGGNLIQDDDGPKLSIVNTFPGIAEYANKRVYSEFTSQGLLENDTRTYNINLLYLKTILSKAYIPSNGITPVKEIELGQDPIEITDLWIGGGFVNAFFSYYSDYIGITHFINLVLDQSLSNDDKKVFVFRHNAMSDLPRNRANGVVSFDIFDVLSGAKSTAKFFLQWKKYDGTSREVEIPVRTREVFSRSQLEDISIAVK